MNPADIRRGEEDTVEMSVARQPVTVELEDGDRVTAHVYAGEGPSSSVVLAHGAGAGQLSPFIVRFARGLARREEFRSSPSISRTCRKEDASPTKRPGWRAPIAPS